METETRERHPFRFILKFLIFVGIIYVAGRMLQQKKSEYYGISESEARIKIETKLGPRMGEDKAAELADQIIPKLKEKGVITDDEPHEVVDTDEAVGESSDDETEEEDEATAKAESE